MKQPGPDHPITIEPNPRRVIVRFAGQIIADSRRSHTLREADLPPVHYIPRADVDMHLLRHSTQHSHCPYKGDASYYSIVVGGTKAENAVWCYEKPFSAVAAIAGALAFYPDRVDAISEDAA